jgi:uncharacterized protein (TIGR02117 family)
MVAFAWLWVVLLLASCSTAVRRSTDVAPSGESGPPVTIYVVKRSWHTDIGFNATDLHQPLATLRAALPEAYYLLFGFGDKHYLLNHGGSLDGLIGAVWPGEGLVLVTGLEGSPEQAFGADAVMRLSVSAAQARRLEDFVWKTLASRAGVASSLAPGPYSGSLYYDATVRYSGLHTCNTWTAEGLEAAGLPVHSFGVEFAGQVWRQVRKLELAAPATNAADARPALP